MTVLYKLTNQGKVVLDTLIQIGHPMLLILWPDPEDLIQIYHCKDQGFCRC